MTPNRPEATCLIALLRSVPKRSGFSPPSPQLDIVPRPLSASAIVSCASGESEPSDIAPPTKRLTIDSTGSTSSIGTGAPSRNAKRERSVTPLSLSMESV